MQERWHNFDPELAPQNGVCQGTSTPVDPSARDIIIAQRGTSLRIFFWLGRLIEACGGRGWKFQCILSSVDTFLVLSYSTSSVVFMWWSMVLRSIFFILQNIQIARGLSCNQFRRGGREPNRRE